MLDVEVADDTQVEAKRSQLRTGIPSTPASTSTAPAKPSPCTICRSTPIAARKTAGSCAWPSLQGPHWPCTTWERGRAPTTPQPGKWASPPPASSGPSAEIIWYLHDLVTVAYRRYCVVKGITPPDGSQLQTSVTEVARADNQTIASATLSIVRALAISARQNWIDDETALSIALKFAGENYPSRRSATSSPRPAARMETTRRRRARMAPLTTNNRPRRQEPTE